MIGLYKTMVAIVICLTDNKTISVLFWLVLFLPSVCHFESTNSVKGGVSGSAVRGGGEVGGDVISVCQIQGCNCTSAAHYSWLLVNCTFDNKQIIDLIPGSVLTSVQEISISGGKEVRFSAQALTPLVDLQRVRVQSAGNVVIKRHSFLNLTTTRLLLEIVECARVVIETESFKNIVGPVSVNVTRSPYVVLQKNAFSYLLDAVVADVPRLELAEGAFSFDYKNPAGRHGRVTTIHLLNVMIPELPANTFSSSMAEVRLSNSEVRSVQPSAFSANTIFSVVLTNTSLHRVDRNAFDGRTLLQSLEITGCRVHSIDTGAILSAVENLTVHHSRFSVVNSGAINITVATVSIADSNFENISSHSFVFNNWNRVAIDRNVFRVLDNNSFDLSFIATRADVYEFSFNSNDIVSVTSSGLKFLSDIIRKDCVPTPHFELNHFSMQCHCEMKNWLTDVISDNKVLERFIDTNFCTVNELLARCFNLVEGFINMRNFTELVCDSKDVIKCPPMTEQTRNAIESVNKQLILNQNNDQNSRLLLVLILSVVFIIVVCGVVIMLMVKGGLWLKRKGYCIPFVGFRYSPNDEIGSTDAEDIMVTVDNKNNETENLPNELTPELLQTLREKLEDPETYNEARDMIERLYDHFLVEETYNNNEAREHAEETHLYEELNARQSTPADADKLATSPARPFSFLRLIEEKMANDPSTSGTAKTLLVGEYAEPMDAAALTKDAADMHIYSELPATESDAKICKMSSRPLPERPRRRDDAGEGTSTQDLL